MACTYSVSVIYSESKQMSVVLIAFKQYFFFVYLYLLLYFLNKYKFDRIYSHSFYFHRGTLEGKWQKPEYEKLLSNPMLKFSGLYQDGFADLMVVCQVFSDGRPLALPVSTSYKAFTTRWK